MLETIAPFIVGLTGSLHCMGMCGPLILAWSLRYRHAHQTGSTDGAVSAHFNLALFHHLAFHAGRITTYGVLGAIAAGISSSLEIQKFSMQYRGGFALASGIALICLGLLISRAFPLPSFVVRLLSPSASVFGRSLSRLVASGSPASKVGLGTLVGLLPCGLTWAMLVAAASTLSPAKGLLTMVSFGLGTIPLLLAAGMSATFLSVRARLLGERAAALLVIVMGALWAIRGLGVILGYGDHCGPTELLLKAGLLR